MYGSILVSKLPTPHNFNQALPANIILYTPPIEWPHCFTNAHPHPESSPPPLIILTLVYRHTDGGWVWQLPTYSYIRNPHFYVKGKVNLNPLHTLSSRHTYSVSLWWRMHRKQYWCTEGLFPNIGHSPCSDMFAMQLLWCAVEDLAIWWDHPLWGEKYVDVFG